MHGYMPLTRLTPELSSLRDTVRTYAESEIAPLTKQMDDAGALDPKLLSGLFTQGFMGIEVPERYGGTGLGFTDSCVIIEEISRVDPAVGVLVDIHNTLINRALIKFGTDEQKDKYLPKLASTYPGSFAISESGAGSDAFGLKTKAEKVTVDQWAISGEKMWISNSAEAGLFLVFARTDQFKTGGKGLTAFLVERDTPGLVVGKKEDKLGIRASSTCTVSFDKAKTTEVLGEEGKGGAIAVGLLNEGRIGIGAQMLGLAKGAFELGLKHLLSREQFGKKLYDFQGIRFQVARARTEIEAAHLLVYNAAALKEACDRGEIESKDFIKEASMSNLYSSEVAERTASQVIEWLGGAGFTKEYGAEKFFRDSKIGSIYEGTSNMQLETIAKQIMTEID